MKTMSCDRCSHEAHGETFEAWMEALKPHYAQAHMDFMKQKGALPQEEQVAEMQKWMMENKIRFDEI
ncbi:MAG: hypothetical protein WD509_02430 [Candidatus Paceibacterota bacterium]